MVDLVLRGDTVVTPQGVGAYDIAIAGEKIVAVAARAACRLPDGARLIDARARSSCPAASIRTCTANGSCPTPTAAPA